MNIKNSKNLSIKGSPNLQVIKKVLYQKKIHKKLKGEKMKKLFSVIIILLLTTVQSALAWDTWNPSFYAGVGYGYSKVDTGITGLTGTSSLDENDSGFKIFGGFKINQFLGIELGYSDLGKAELKGNNGDTFSLGGTTYQFLVDGVSMGAEATSIQISAIYFIPLDYFTGQDSMKYFEPFIKVGVNFWEIEYSMSTSNIDQVRADDDGNDLVFGAGINFKIYDRIGLRAEWERFQTEEDIDYFSGSVIFTF